MLLKKNFINVAEMDWEENEHGEKYESKRKRLAANTDAEKLGASLYEVPPGKTAWPRHYHLVNEEALFILSGEGTLEYGRNSVTVSEGDYVTLKAGERCAHQLHNDGDEPLRYLCVSTMEEPDVVMYPDSEKVGVFAGSAPGGDKEKRTYHAYHRTEDAVDYWDGE